MMHGWLVPCVVLAATVASCRDRMHGPAPSQREVPHDAAVTMTSDSGSQAGVPRRGLRTTRLEREPAVATPEHDVIDESPPCAPGSDVVELRVDAQVSGPSRTLRASLKSCSSGSVSFYFNPHFAPLDVDAFDAAGVPLRRASSMADAKFDNTPYCSYLRTLAPGQERHLEDVHITERGGVVDVTSGAMEIRGAAAQIRVSLPSIRRDCVERNGTRRLLPADTWRGRAVAAPVVLPKFGRPAPPANETAAGTCTCPEITWSNGPALAEWQEHALDRQCRLTRKELGRSRPRVCTATLGCEGLGGARALEALLEDPLVKLALAADADFGARELAARDAPVERLRSGSTRLMTPQCLDASSCPGVPRVVVDLMQLARAYDDSYSADGGVRRGLALSTKKCM